MNTTGAHIPLWLDGDSARLGGASQLVSHQDGIVLRNIFVSPPTMYYCNGKDFAVGVVPGRIGAGNHDSPYKNPYSGSGYCRTTAPAGSTHQADGYKAVRFNHSSPVAQFWRHHDVGHGIDLGPRLLLGHGVHSGSVRFGSYSGLFGDYSGSNDRDRRR